MSAAPVAVLILAAGAASRMRGGDKCLEPVGGEALLRRLARASLAVGLPVTVALPPDRPLRGAALDGLPVGRVVVADAALGLSASLRAGLDVLPPGAVLVLLADLPEITEGDLLSFVGAMRADPAALWRGAATDGTPGHPVGLPHDLRAEAMALSGDGGARPLFQRHAGRVRLCPLPGRNAVTDLDTPEDWAAWRAGRPCAP